MIYRISFYGKRYREKPQGKEIARINKKLSTVEMTHDYIANLVGESGCTFSPVVFTANRNTDNFLEKQLIVLDFDDGTSFAVIKERADRYGLPILFAYKSFSWTSEHEKFRVVFAMDRPITDRFTAETVTAIFMKIFSEADQSCKDSARMFFGGKGLHYIAEQPIEIGFDRLLIAFNSYMYNRYDENHYAKHIREFYAKINVETDKKLPVYTYDISGAPVIKKTAEAKTVKKSERKHETKAKRRKTTSVDFEILKKRCRLYKDFVGGSAYYYYPELFMIATNMINMDKGKTEFLRILNSPENSEHEAYHQRDWKPILNTLIDMGYSPQSCYECPHARGCPHFKNMILTVNPGYCGIRPLEIKKYCTIDEAEQSLAENFLNAVNSEKFGIKIIVAQTGIGKTNMYLNYLRDTEIRFLIAAPTHKLIRELYQKAKTIGVDNIRFVPEMPVFSDDLMEKIQHTYSVGAGEVGLETLREIYNNMKPADRDYIALGNYLREITDVMNYDGHIIMTHERFLYLNPDSELMKGRKIIIDEDILRTAFCTIAVNNDDIHKAKENNRFSQKSKDRMENILSVEGYQKYEDTAGVSVDTELADQLKNISSNIVDLLHAKALVNDGVETTYIKEKAFPCRNAIIMSATANADMYKWLFHIPVEEYRCKQAKYMGKIHLYTNSSYSRHALTQSEKSGELMKFVRDIVKDDEIITFKSIEDQFNTEYHFGGIEGLNCLEGHNISVIGLPNVDERVYKLYGMLMGVDPDKDNMKYTKIQHNDCGFYMNTFHNYRLRTIQLWMLESLLEQAVGRARLLRYDCTVNVFARFPIDQAEVM